MNQIIINEWRMLLRVKALTNLTLFFMLALILVTWFGVKQNGRQQEQQKEAQAHVRKQWENITNLNPHGAAHYGSYAFKPITPLSSLDEGVNSSTGNVLRLEGHVQNEIAYSEASQSTSISKFGKLKPALLLQYVIPLFLIFLAFSSVSREKETGRLKLLVFQGAPLSKLIFAKTLSVWVYGLLMLSLTIIVQMLVNMNGLDADSFGRMLLLFLSYAVYYYIITAIVTYFSARLPGSAASLSAMLALWMMWTVFLPKIWGNTVDKVYPLPSRKEFKTGMAEDRSKGIDGHNPSDKREEVFKNEILAKYKVDSVSQLPINFDGLLMQADEDYGNKVWDKHFGENDRIFQKQKVLYQFSGLLNPFASLQSASMGFSGSDMLHHQDFLLQAEQYRRVLIKSLNDKHAFGGSKSGDYSWQPEPDFYKSVKDFNYIAPDAGKTIKYYFIDVLCLLIWASLATFIIFFNSKNIRLV